MKFTKLVPIALALSLISPAFAADSATSTINLTMPASIDIAQDTATQVLAQTLTPDYVAGDIGTLTAKAAWNVTTNLNGDVIYLSAKARENSTQKAALYGTDSQLYIVFTNIGGNAGEPGAGAATGTIENIITAGAAAGGSTSTDAIVFSLGEEITPSGAGTAPAKAAVADGSAAAPAGTKARTYTLHNGTYNIVNALESVYANSFDTYDTAGIYQAVITLSHTAPQ